MTAEPVAGAAWPPDVESIEVRVGELKQLFNAMDPAPFNDRDLDPNAEQFIVEWARDAPAERPLGLTVHLSREHPGAEDGALLQQAVREYFASRAVAERRRLRRLFRVGRISLVIGVLFVGVAIALGDLVVGLVGRYDYGQILADSLTIGAWVALWRPIEIFLYDWWPIRAEARLYDRLGAMPVRVLGAAPGNGNAPRG